MSSDYPNGRLGTASRESLQVSAIAAMEKASVDASAIGFTDSCLTSSICRRRRQSKDSSRILTRPPTGDSRSIASMSKGNEIVKEMCRGENTAGRDTFILFSSS